MIVNAPVDFIIPGSYQPGMLTPLVLVFHGGSKFIAPKDIFGNTCTDFDAAEAIWGFFEHLGRK